jgi:hypothetical protein
MKALTTNKLRRMERIVARFRTPENYRIFDSRIALIPNAQKARRLKRRGPAA